MTSHDIGGTPDSDTAMATGCAVRALAQLTARAAEWERLIRFDAIERVRIRLALDGFEVWLLTWLPQQSTSWHVHQSAGCFATVVGALTEQMSTYPSAVDLDSPDVTAPRVVRVPAPERVLFPSRHLHRVVNLGLEPAVSLHVLESSRTQTLAHSLSGPHPHEHDVSAEAEEQLLTPGEVATYFRVHPKTITRWAESGQLKSVRTLGNHRRFLASEVRALRRGHHE